MFVMLFTVGTGYFLWVFDNNGTYSQAQAGRNEAVQMQQSEKVTIVPGTCTSGSCTSGDLTFVAENIGSFPSTLQVGYVDSVSGTCSNPIDPPNGLTLNSGTVSTSIDTGCPYTGISVVVRVLSSRGNVFSAPYPPSTSSCTGISSPTIKTALSASIANQPVPAGNAVTDTALLSGGCNPTGNITFSVYTTASCTGSVFWSGLVIVNGNGAYTSPNFVPKIASPPSNPSGFIYYWQAAYSGDASNSPFTTACAGNVVLPSPPNTETLKVKKAITSITTLLSSSQIPSGQSVSDASILSGSSGNANGTVTYSFYSNGNCTGSPMITPSVANGLNVTVTNSNIPNSPSETFISVGSYGWNAVYSGDPNNNAATSHCEQLSVIGPTTQTQLPLAIEINSFRFLYAQSKAVGDGSAPGVKGYYGYVVPTSTNLVFVATLVNVDPFGRSISLNQFSFLYVNVLSNGGGQCYAFPMYILGSASGTSPYTSGTTTTGFGAPVVIPSQGQATIYFGPSAPLGTGGSTLACASGGKTPSPLEAAVAPFMTGEFSDGTPLSLTLPFTSIYASPAGISTCSPSQGGNQCWAKPGETIHVAFSSGSFGSTPSVYYVSSFGAMPTLVGCSGGTCSATDYYFTAPALATPAYYMIFATDGANYAYATLHLLTPTSTTVACSAITGSGANRQVTCSATITGSGPTPTGTVTFTNAPSGGTYTTGATCTLSGGVCSVTWKVPSSGFTGIVTFTATYSGDVNYRLSVGTKQVTF